MILRMTNHNVELRFHEMKEIHYMQVPRQKEKNIMIDYLQKVDIFL
jgi:hypothetical protein